MFNLIELEPVRHTRHVVNARVCLSQLLFGADVLEPFEGQEVEVVATHRRHAVALFKNGKHIGDAPLLNGEFLDFDFIEVPEPLAISHQIENLPIAV